MTDWSWSRLIITDGAEDDAVVLEIDGCYIFKLATDSDFNPDVGLSDTDTQTKVARLHESKDGRLMLEVL